MYKRQALIYQTEKLIKENEGVIGDLKDKILAMISDLKAAMESENVPRINSAMESLQKELHQVSSRLYGQQTGYGTTPGPPPSGMGDTSNGKNYGSKTETEDERQAEKFRKATGQDDVIDTDYS